jgi:hypothetical protein
MKDQALIPAGQFVTELKANEIFVFGSNLAGRHGAGAAYTAYVKFGAVYGVGAGRTGQCYAIPTKDYNINTLPLRVIEEHVNAFYRYARLHGNLTFLVTPIGCGLAGYTYEDIAPLFLSHGLVKNITLPAEFIF